MNNEVTQVLGECIEAMENGELTLEECLGLYPEYKSEVEPLLRLVLTLKASSEVMPSETFQETAVSRFIQRNLPVEQKPSRSPWMSKMSPVKLLLSPGPSRIAALVTAFILIFISTLTVHASNFALPGDPTYSLKIHAERFRLAFADEESEVTLQIEFADSRQREIQSLTEIQRITEIDKVEESYTEHLDKAAQGLIELMDREPGVYTGLAEEVDETLSNHIQKLENLLDKVPESAKPAINHAIESSSKNQKLIQEKKKEEQPKKGGKPEDPGKAEKKDEQPKPADQSEGNKPEQSNPSEGNPKDPGIIKAPHEDPDAAPPNKPPEKSPEKPNEPPGKKSPN